MLILCCLPSPTNKKIVLLKQDTSLDFSVLIIDKYTVCSVGASGGKKVGYRVKPTCGICWFFPLDSCDIG